jgi:hypothetical protein
MISIGLAEDLNKKSFPETSFNPFWPVSKPVKAKSQSPIYAVKICYTTKVHDQKCVQGYDQNY